MYEEIHCSLMIDKVKRIPKSVKSTSKITKSAHSDAFGNEFFLANMFLQRAKNW